MCVLLLAKLQHNQARIAAFLIDATGDMGGYLLSVWRSIKKACLLSTHVNSGGYGFKYLVEMCVEIRQAKRGGWGEVMMKQTVSCLQPCTVTQLK